MVDRVKDIFFQFVVFDSLLENIQANVCCDCASGSQFGKDPRSWLARFQFSVFELVDQFVRKWIRLKSKIRQVGRISQSHRSG